MPDYMIRDRIGGSRMTLDELHRIYKRLGLTQEAAADLIGRKARALRYWLSGAQDVEEPSARLLRLINHCLGRGYTAKRIEKIVTSEANETDG